MVHVLGHYFDAADFWAVVPAACGTVLAGIIVLVVYMYVRSSNKRRVKVVETRLDVMLRNMSRMAKYVDGLPKSERAVRKPFERGRAAMDAYKWDKAIGRFRQAMKEAKGTELVALFNLIGLCHYTLGRLDDALRNYEKSAVLAEQFGDKRGKAAGLGNIGLIYSAKGEPDKALKYYDEALVMDREIGYQQGVANQLGNIGLIYRAKGELDRELMYGVEALASYREIGHQPGVASALSNIGNAYVWAMQMKIATSPWSARNEQVDGLAQRAIEYLVPALGMFLEMGIADGPSQCLWGLGECYRVLGREEFVALCAKAGMANEQAEALAEERSKATE